MLHIYRPLCDGCNTVKRMTDSTPYTMSSVLHIVTIFIHVHINIDILCTY